MADRIVIIGAGSTSARAGAVSTWARPRSATAGLESGSRSSASPSATAATSCAGDMATDEGDARAKYLAEILRYRDASRTPSRDAVAGDEFPLVLGGDHSLAIGVLGGLAAARTADRGRCSGSTPTAT